jgi:DnaJ domain
MQTLYEVLGALPSDDAEGLRAAFRKAVKGAHPDVHPDDPDAALKFREIIRANDILIDDEQRAAYDHLLDLAQLEQDSASRHAIAAKVHKFASGVIALTGVSVVTVGGYLVFLHMSAAALPLTHKIDIAMRSLVAVASVRPPTWPDMMGKTASSAKLESASLSAKVVAPAAKVVAPAAAMPESDAGGVPVVTVSLAPDSNALPAPGVLASRNADPSDAPAELDPAIDLDLASSPAYTDQGIVFYHLRRFERVFADLARARRIQKESHSRSASAMAGKPRLNQAAIAPSVTPLPPSVTPLPLSLTPLPRRRPSMRDPSREEVFTSAMR